MKKIANRKFDEERALYHTRHAEIIHCEFAGPADGESALKESEDIALTGCSFSLRYPLWHVRGFSMKDTVMNEPTRAAIWYACDGQIENCSLNGIKAVRECERIHLRNCRVNSPEFGWKCRGISLEETEITSEYLFLDSRDISLRNVRMQGKYSFQYAENLTIENSVLNTKDAFWHAKNVTVRNSVVKGEYLAWFSEGLTLIDCRLIGTQPLCYCRNLRLIRCTMEEADLAFEYSEAEADVLGSILSVKNLRAGRVVADSVGEIIREGAVMPCTGEVLLRKS